jgi:hypothetical protein
MFYRGVNFTAERGAPYGSDASAEQLRRLPPLGVDSIALVPYGFSRPGSTDIRFNLALERDDGIRRLADAAHELKMSVMLKPQIWGPGFTGDIEFADPQPWFDSYARMAEHYARLAESIRAELFCAGNEFGKLSIHEAQWRRIIAIARGVYRGRLTYAAVQGPEFETLRFGDALDCIGLNNYYPLPDSLSFALVAAKVETVHRRFRKPVIFTECGYSSLVAPHRAPWDETPRELSMDDQARCYESLLKSFYGTPWVCGFYFWKLGTNGFGGPQDGSHTPWGKPAMDVLSRWYRTSLRR